MIMKRLAYRRIDRLRVERVGLGARRAFTLIELLVVMALIATLMGLLLPGIRNTQTMAHTTRCRANLRQLAAAASIYSAAHHGRLPDRTAWSYDNTNGDILHLTMAVYLGLPMRRPHGPREGLLFDSVFTCPASMRFPGPAYGTSYHRTYQLNAHMAGSSDWRPYTRNDLRGWFGENSDSERLRAPLFTHRVPTPSGAAQFYDGVSFQHPGMAGDESLQYTTHSSEGHFQAARRHLRHFPHRNRPGTGVYTTTPPADDDMINVGFLDGHSRGLRRLQMEAYAGDWMASAFFGQ